MLFKSMHFLRRCSLHLAPGFVVGVLACLALLIPFRALAQNLSATSNGNVCLANVTQSNPLIPEADMTGIVFFNGNYVAVSSNGVAMSSPDGTHWTQTVLPGSFPLSCLAANGTEIIAAGVISYNSTDGIHWTRAGSISTALNTINAITWTGNEWLAVGADGEIDTSPDGAAWTNQLMLNGNFILNAVVSTGSNYVAVCNNSIILTSVDSKNWIQRVSSAIGTTTDLIGLAYDPDRGHQVLVAVATNGGIFTSTDQGTTWTASTSPSTVGWQNVRWIESAGLFVAVGANETIATSPDGINWTLATANTVPPSSPKLYNLADIAANLSGTQAVTVGDHTTIFNTANFSTWTQCYLGVFGQWNGLASNGTLGLIEVGNGQDAFSANGGASFSIGNMPKLFYLNKSQIFNATAVAYSPTLAVYVAVGNDNTVEQSTNGGLTWTLGLTYNNTIRIEPTFNAVTWAGSQFVAVGNAPSSAQAGDLSTNKSDSPSYLQLSANGINWTVTGYGAATQNMNAVAADGIGGVVAVGENGEIVLTSNINVSINAQWVGTGVTGANLTGVAFGNGTWVVVGANGTVLTSNDVPNPDETFNWTKQSLGGPTPNLNSVIFANSFFFAFGADGNIYQSLNGVSWTRCVGPEAPGVGLKSAAVSALGLNILSAANNTFLGQTILPAAAAFSAQPGNQTVVSGQNATFSAVSTGSPSPAVQWQLSTDGGATWSNLTDSATITGSSTSSLTLSGTMFVMSGNVFRLVATNPLGSLASAPAILTVTPLSPSITSPPANLTVNAGQSAQFSVAASGDPIPSYQWQLSSNGGTTWGNLTDSGNISGSATANLTVANTTFAQNGDLFRALAINLGNTSFSPPANLTVQTLPAVLAQPGNLTASVGQTATFAVSASGNPAPAYQWQVSSDGGLSWANLTDGNGIIGSTASTLSVANVILAMSQREFRVVLTNVVGSVSSSAGILTVISKPAITTLSGNQTGIAGGNVTFSVNAGGSPPLKYQWQFNGHNIIGATNSTYVIRDVKTTNAGKYDVVITNASGHLTSPSLTLTVLVPPTIATLPKTATVKAGAKASFTVHATGTLPFTYLWKFDGNPITAFNVTGANTSTLTITKAGSANAGSYLVIVTNAAGSVPSSSVTLTVK
jgi:hypothetical protein